MILISWIAVVLIMILFCCLLEYWITPVIPRMSGSRRRRWPTNFAFYFINTGLHFAIPISTVTAAKYAESEGLGILNVIELPNWIDCLMTACFISFASYLFHLAMPQHKVARVPYNSCPFKQFFLGGLWVYAPNIFINQRHWDCLKTSIGKGLRFNVMHHDMNVQ